MNKILVFFIVLVLLSGFMVSCCRFETSNCILLRADSLMQSSPDSALKLLYSLPYNSLSNSEQIYHGLLVAQGTNKCNLSLLSCDSLVDVALDYYGRGEKKIRALMYKERIQREMGMNKEAMDNCFIALKEINLGDSKQIHLKAMLHADLGLLYKGKHLYERATEQFCLAYHCDSLVANVKGMMVSLMNMGDVYTLLDNKETALECYESAFVHALHQKDSLFMGMLCHNQSLAYDAFGEFDMALKYAQRSLSFYSDTDDSFNSYINIGWLYYQKNQLDSAKYYLEEGLNTTNVGPRAIACAYLAELEKAEENYQLALSYNEQYAGLLDSLNQQNEVSDIERLAYKYEAEIRVNEEKKQMLLLIRSVISVSIIFILILIIFYHQILKRRKIAQLMYEEESGRLKRDINQCQLEIVKREKLLKYKDLEIKKVFDEKEKLCNLKFRETAIFQTVVGLSEQKVFNKKELMVLRTEEQKVLRSTVFEIYSSYITYLHNNYHGVSEDDCLYCCLRLCDFDDQTIALCLGNINKQIVIQRRSRLKAKMKKAIFND